MFENFDWIQAMRNSPVMVVILGCSVATFGFALERLVYFWRRRGHPDQVLSGALERIRAGNLKEAAWVCTTSAHPVGAVAKTVIESPHLPTDSVEEKMQIALSEQKLQLERHLGWLGTMGNTAPLIGLLGTVWGIMRAFHDMARTGSAGPSVVAAGIAEALFTTAAGLIVAVPAVMLYNHFVRRTQVMLTVSENHARTIRIAMEQSRLETKARSNAGDPAARQTPLFVEAA
jgi:biopolymer transport protein ExbB